MDPGIQILQAINSSSDTVERDSSLLHIRDLQEEETMDQNINQVARDGDLSPKHIYTLKSGGKKTRQNNVVPLQEFMDLFPSSEVSHIIRHGSDHAPLHVVCDTQEEVVVKPFKFLNFLSQHPKFLDLVQDNWCLDFAANPFFEFQATMKKAELNSYLHLEEEHWKQKSGMRWFKDGDKNTKFFHSYVKGRRKKLALQRIQNSQGDWISSNDDIGEEAVTFYQDQFRELATSTDYEMLKKIPALISTEQK
ncbi:uncharacterized protein LOC132038577 [Lycium ferocissimum]|uniref:uncharacterized protein LOC132038577 n=1 Tax=Lycium ferocissimum TaxID=112874 RepID=UPI0028159FF6|nr:uncharacterized protein LOC132038577 [Lycium ferocissimum]